MLSIHSVMLKNMAQNQYLLNYDQNTLCCYCECRRGAGEANTDINSASKQEVMVEDGGARRHPNTPPTHTFFFFLCRKQDQNDVHHGFGESLKVTSNHCHLKFPSGYKD